jgi:FKBP-type peptidyl-prolyl cis-trans isomerase
MFTSFRKTLSCLLILPLVLALGSPLSSFEGHSKTHDHTHDHTHTHTKAQGEPTTNIRAQPKTATHSKTPYKVKAKSKGFEVPDIKGLPAKKLGQLKYWVMKKGEGKKPARGQRVKVHYGGWLKSGKIFDSSYSRNQPFAFTLGGRVIDGWNMMVAEMKPGEALVVQIPPHLGYGSYDMGSIPPNSTLFFKIELLGFR